MVEKVTAAEFLEDAITLSDKTQAQISAEVGYTKPNVLSMMKKGRTKIPLDKVPALAKACGVDPVAFLRVVMQEYQPANWEVIQSIVGNPLTKEEESILNLVRETGATLDDVSKCLNKADA